MLCIGPPKKKPKQNTSATLRFFLGSRSCVGFGAFVFGEGLWASLCSKGFGTSGSACQV